MSETNLMKAGTEVLSAYLNLLHLDGQVSRYRDEISILLEARKSLQKNIADADDIETIVKNGEALLVNKDYVRQLQASLEEAEAAVDSSIPWLKDAVLSFGHECVASGSPAPRTRGKTVYVSFLSARASGLCGAERGAYACRFGDAWASASSYTYSHAKRELAYEEVCIKLSGKIFQ